MLNVIPLEAPHEDEQLKRFDTCFCTLDFNALLSLRDIVSNVKTAMKPGGKIIVFHVKDTHRPMTKREVSLIFSSALAAGSSAVNFAGFSLPLIPHVARKLTRIAIGSFEKGGLHGMLIPAVAMLLSVPFARLANMQFGQRQRPPTMPRYRTSVTIEINIT
jgi:hypothetical protein